MKNYTIVTGLWNLGRDNLKDFGRSFDHYLKTFEELLTLDINMCIWVPHELESFVAQRRSKNNTKIYLKDKEEFETYFPYFNEVQRIRTKESWYKQIGWLENSPQAKLEYYNPIMMSKFLLVNEAAKENPFNTDYFFWLDAGITNTCGTDDLRNMDALPEYMEENDDKFLFLSYPYETDIEVHGFEHKKFYEFCGVKKTSYVCRGGFFGGHNETISLFTERQQQFAKDSLQLGYMGADECIHTMIAYRYEDEVNRFMLNDDGLVYAFFSQLNNVNTSKVIKNINLIPYDKKKTVEDIKTSLYVLTYNSPDQFAKLLESYQEADSSFISFTRKILVDNSTKSENYMQYQSLCKKYGFEHIRKEDNLGICGGRQFIADHFNESDSEYYCFLEDDMNLNIQKDRICASGFRTYTEDLYKKSLAIIHKEQYDFLKFSYSEFFGTNQTQWAWYNIPQKTREKYFPNNPFLPEDGLDPNAPKIEVTNRKRFKDLYYLEGDYYYCNWPIWMNRRGNAKVFLETRWQYPNEQTWMSHCFQQQKRGIIKSAVLELSPIFHHRFDFYPAEERKES